MESPGEPANDRRAVPRHLRDGEHDPTTSGVFSMRAEDLRGVRRGRLWALLVLALALAAAAAWYALRR